MDQLRAAQGIGFVVDMRALGLNNDQIRAAVLRMMQGLGPLGPTDVDKPDLEKELLGFKGPPLEDPLEPFQAGKRVRGTGAPIIPRKRARSVKYEHPFESQQLDQTIELNDPTTDVDPCGFYDSD
jgi:hypothetical protein